jgi:Hsp20/alpha crystallin family
LVLAKSPRRGGVPRKTGGDSINAVYPFQKCPRCSATSRIETYRHDNDYVVRLDVPGVDPKDVQVQIEGNLLSISGERKTDEKGSDYQETHYGKFERTVSLPKVWSRRRLRLATSMTFLKSECRFRRSLPDGRSRLKSSKMGIRSWNQKPLNLERFSKSPICRRFKGGPKRTPLSLDAYSVTNRRADGFLIK